MTKKNHNLFMTVIRQVCCSHNMAYTYDIHYHDSIYDIVYHISEGEVAVAVDCSK